MNKNNVTQGSCYRFKNGLPKGLATDFRMGPGANEIGKNRDVLYEIGKNCDINSKHINP